MFMIRSAPPLGYTYPVLVDGTAVASDVSTNDAITLNYPSGSAAGDLIIACGTWQKSFTASTTNTMSGGAVWRRIWINDQDALSPAVAFAYFWCFRGSETSATFTPSGSTNFTAIAMAAYKGASVDAINPVGGAADVFSENIGGAVTTGGFINPVDLAEILTFSVFSQGDQNFTVSWSGNTVVELNDTSEGPFGGVYAGVSIGHDQKATAGSVTGYTATPSYGLQDDRHACAMSVLPPNVFPGVVSSVTGSNHTAGTSQAITTWPADISGDLRLVLFAANGNQTLSTSSSGWTKVGQINNSTNVTIGVFAGISGTANNTLTITHAGSVHRSWTVHSIRRWSGTISHIEMATATGTSGTPDPPNLAPTHGTQSYLWVVAEANNDGLPADVEPGDFTEMISSSCSIASTSTTDVGHSSAWRLANNSSLNPGGFVRSSNAWAAVTIAIRP